MAFTKITHAGIGSTGTVLLENLEVTGVGTFGGSVSVGGTLTYEDVTNIDSVGLVTARNGIVVGSGITLSKDGDGFFTGIVTATSFSGSGANLTGIDTDLVSDTSPQLGGNLDVNTKNIVFGDSGSASDDRLTFGAGTDLSIYHDGTHSYVVNTVGNLRIQNNGTIKNAQFEVDTVDFNDSANSEVRVRINSDGLSLVQDNDKVQIGASQDLKLYHDGSNSYIDETGTGGLLIRSGNIYLRNPSNADMIHAQSGGYVKLYHNGSERLETLSDGVKISGNRLNITDTGSVDLYLSADTDNSDESHVPRLHFVQDGSATRLIIGSEGTAGTAFSNALGNSPYLMSVGSVPLLVATDSVGRWQFTSSGHFNPMANDTYDIGSSSYRVRDIYTGDLNLSNEGKKDKGGNDVDGTWGDYTIQEGESDLFLINNRSGKKYKFNLTEVS